MSDQGPPLHSPASAGDDVRADDDPAAEALPRGDGAPGAPGDPESSFEAPDAQPFDVPGGAEPPRATPDAAADIPEAPESALVSPPLVPPGSSLCMLVAALVLIASLVGKLLAPALPGVRAHFERWISLTETTAAVTSQGALVAGAVATGILLITTLRISSLSVFHRLTTAVLGAGVLTVLASAYQYRIRAESLLLVAIATSLLGVWASHRAAENPQTRGAALVVLAASLSSIIQVVGRALAGYASDNALPSLFDGARSLATLGLAVDVLALTIACLWLALPSPRRGAVPLALAALAATVVILASLSGSKPDASLFEVISSRVTAQLATHPAPWLPGALRAWVVLFGFGVVGAVLLSPGWRRLTAVVIALALLARGAADTPIYALSLLLAALLAPLAALMRGGHQADEVPVSRAPNSLPPAPGADAVR